MNFTRFKYILIFCFAAVLMLKASGSISYLNCFSNRTENVSSDQDNAEKEEKKTLTEYFDDHFLAYQSLKPVTQSSFKIIIRNDSFILLYNPEVLTPPPSLFV